MRKPSLRAAAAAAALLGALAACGSTDTGVGGGGTSPSQAADSLQVFPQNSALLVGVNRISVALVDAKKNPVLNAQATVDVMGPNGKVETRPLEFVGSSYTLASGEIPVYIGLARFPSAGPFRYVVHATLAGGGSVTGQAYITVAAASQEIPVGAHVPAVSQRVAADVGGKLSDIDSGVPPDTFHDETVAQALARHQPMVLFLGEPGRCPSQTCAPTLRIVQQLCAQYCSRMVFEHIEVHDPASADTENPAFAAFHLQSEPWVYFVNADGIVTDHFEGPLTLDQLQQSAAGTLAGRVPAVDLSLS